MRNCTQPRPADHNGVSNFVLQYQIYVFLVWNSLCLVIFEDWFSKTVSGFLAWGSMSWWITVICMLSVLVELFESHIYWQSRWWVVLIRIFRCLLWKTKVLKWKASLIVLFPVRSIASTVVCMQEIVAVWQNVRAFRDFLEFSWVMWESWE